MLGGQRRGEEEYKVGKERGRGRLMIEAVK
jgi:hypothetical protein